MKREPNRSLAIVAMNQTQRELINIEFERCAQQDPEVRRYCEQWLETTEPFIIKNLESIQGDERDVVLISTVYGPDARGKTHQRFGPINSKTGWRRLNVLFTRAKFRVEVFTSLRPADIIIGEGSSRGSIALRDYLEYAETGKLHAGIRSNRSPDSDFEEAVAEGLRRKGYACVPQVGVGNYYVDLGVVDPTNTSTFILGIECDGAMYHSSKSARDRDRLREDALRRLGWELHRIWSTDWFANPERELERLTVSIENHLQNRDNTRSLHTWPEKLEPNFVNRQPIRDDVGESDASVEQELDLQLFLNDRVAEGIIAILEARGRTMSRPDLMSGLSAELRIPIDKSFRSLINKTLKAEQTAGRVFIDESWSRVSLDPFS